MFAAGNLPFRNGAIWRINCKQALNELLGSVGLVDNSVWSGVDTIVIAPNNSDRIWLVTCRGIYHLCMCKGWLCARRRHARMQTSDAPICCVRLWKQDSCHWLCWSRTSSCCFFLPVLCSLNTPVREWVFDYIWSCAVHFWLKDFISGWSPVEKKNSKRNIWQW